MTGDDVYNYVPQGSGQAIIITNDNTETYGSGRFYDCTDMEVGEIRYLVWSSSNPNSPTRAYVKLANRTIGKELYCYYDTTHTTPSWVFNEKTFGYSGTSYTYVGLEGHSFLTITRIS